MGITDLQFVDGAGGYGGGGGLIEDSCKIPEGTNIILRFSVYELVGVTNLSAFA